MARTASGLTQWAPLALSALRIVTALLFGEHGTQKVFEFPVAGLAGTPPSGSGLWWIGVVEIVAATLLLVGLFTRPVAFLMSGMMAIAFWGAHAPRGFWPANNGGEPAILFCFIFLYLTFAGPGSIAVDAFFNRRRPLRV